jgi:uncharacterized membrane protein
MPAQPICWTIKRNCSASPGLLAAVFASMVGLSFVFGVAFATQGLWLILPFVGLELAAVAIAFIAYGRRAADYERITLSAQQISVERVDGPHATQWSFPACSARVEVEQLGGGGWKQQVRVFIASREQRVEVGRHLPVPRRKLLAQELIASLRAAAA